MRRSGNYSLDNTTVPSNDGVPAGASKYVIATCPIKSKHLTINSYLRVVGSLGIIDTGAGHVGSGGELASRVTVGFELSAHGLGGAQNFMGYWLDDSRHFLWNCDRMLIPTFCIEGPIVEKEDGFNYWQPALLAGPNLISSGIAIRSEIGEAGYSVAHVSHDPDQLVRAIPVNQNFDLILETGREATPLFGVTQIAYDFELFTLTQT